MCTRLSNDNFDYSFTDVISASEWSGFSFTINKNLIKTKTSIEVSSLPSINSFINFEDNFSLHINATESSLFS